MSKNTKKGLIFGFLGTLFVGFQPIIANSRPKALDAHIFATMTCFIEAIIFLPILLIEVKLNQRNAKKNNEKVNNTQNFITNWKKNLKLFIFIGFIFGLNQLLFFIGYELAGAINGALTQKTTVFFGLIFGYFILKEKVSKLQILFSIILFFGLVIAITQFSFDIESLEISIILGVLTLLFITCLWMFGHTLTKPIFTRNEATPTQIVFIRNLLSGIMLFSTYFIFFPLENLGLILDPINFFFFSAMGTIYSAGLFCWYKTLSYLDVSKATILFSSTPIVTAIFALILLGETFSIFHFLGTIIILISIVIIMREKRD